MVSRATSTEQSQDAPIEIHDYDPAWPDQFETERRRLEDALAPWLAGPIEHVGSTAIVGLAAKPVIDMMAPVADLESSRGAIAAAQTLQYNYCPYKAEFMHWFCKPSPAHRTHHLHLIPLDSDLWNERLAFRDTLRADRRLAQEYAALKRQLARRLRNDREAYTQAKATFVQQVLSSSRTAR